jgi:hypothetical protein
MDVSQDLRHRTKSGVICEHGRHGLTVNMVQDYQWVGNEPQAFIQCHDPGCAEAQAGKGAQDVDLDGGWVSIVMGTVDPDDEASRGAAACLKVYAIDICRDPSGQPNGP